MQAHSSGIFRPRKSQVQEHGNLSRSHGSWLMVMGLGRNDFILVHQLWPCSGHPFCVSQLACDYATRPGKFWHPNTKLTHNSTKKLEIAYYIYIHIYKIVFHFHHLHARVKLTKPYVSTDAILSAHHACSWRLRIFSYIVYSRRSAFSRYMYIYIYIYIEHRL